MPGRRLRAERCGTRGSPSATTAVRPRNGSVARRGTDRRLRRLCFVRALVSPRVDQFQAARFEVGDVPCRQSALTSAGHRGDLAVNDARRAADLPARAHDLTVERGRAPAVGLLVAGGHCGVRRRTRGHQRRQKKRVTLPSPRPISCKFFSSQAAHRVAQHRNRSHPPASGLSPDRCAGLMDTDARASPLSTATCSGAHSVRRVPHGAHGAHGGVGLPRRAGTG